MGEAKLFEQKNPVELLIKSPRGDKNFMIAFDSKSQKQCRAYNFAIETICREAGLQPFHQIGTTPDGSDSPGYHGWEMWKSEVSEKMLRELFPEIQAKAKWYLDTM